MPNIFFTSDHHFGHANIIKLAARPFGSLEAMHQIMRERWNALVKPGDTVYHLGDFTLGKSEEKATRIESWLNGNVFRIAGNHDAFSWAPSPYVEQTIAGRRFVLCHYPIEDWNGRFRGAIHLHGHTHSDKFTTLPNRFNVCVEATGYAPVALETILEAAQ